MQTIDYYNIININQDALSFINYMVDEYGKVLIISSNKSFEELLPEYHHDYFYFCLTKATRSLAAANELCKMRYREDGMVLARTAYETYLLLANVINNEYFIDKSVIINLKLKIGDASYFKDKSGKIDFKKVKLEGDDKIYSYDLSMSTLAKNTYSTSDKAVHRELYKYMSEFQHSDFIGSGNYRTDNDKKYDVVPNKLYLDIHFIIMYVTYLLLQSMYLEYYRYSNYLFNQIKSEEMQELNSIQKFLNHYNNT